MENTGKTSRKKSRSMIWNLFKTTCRTGQNVTSHRLLHRAAAVLLLAVGFGLLTAGQAVATAPGCPDCAYRRPITIAPTSLGNSCGSGSGKRSPAAGRG